LFRLSRPEDPGGIPKVAAFHRKGWPLWIGTGGRVQSECPAAFKRISHYHSKRKKNDLADGIEKPPDHTARMRIGYHFLFSRHRGRAAGVRIGCLRYG